MEKLLPLFFVLVIVLAIIGTSVLTVRWVRKSSRRAAFLGWGLQFLGFLFHAFTGNPDMALICFVAIGGSAAMAWMFAALATRLTFRRILPDGLSPTRISSIARDN
jgi:hypothetical protein